MFDPRCIREQLHGPVGIPFYLNQSLEQAALAKAVTGTVRGMLGISIQCYLVGYNDAGRKLLQKAREWLESAIAIEEKPRRYFHGGTEATRYENLALCNWLLESVHDADNLHDAVRWSEVWFAENKPDKTEVALTLPVYVDARAYEQAVELAERTPGFRKPKNARAVTHDGRMAYLIAAARCRGEWSEGHVAQALPGFLRHQVPLLLRDGHYPGVARWMKIAFWNDLEAKPSAIEALLRCYDYLPGVPPPDAGT